MSKLFTILTLFLCITIVRAQQIPVNNQYMLNKYSLSPAYAGNNQNVESFLSYRNSWVGVPGAPNATIFTMNGAIPDKNMGLGLSVGGNTVGIFRDVSMSLEYSYHLAVQGMHKLNFGAGVGFYQNYVDLGGRDLTENNTDQVIEAFREVKSGSLNFSFGMLYKYKNLNVGFAIPRTLENKVEDNVLNSTVYTAKRHMMGHASYEFPVKHQWFIEPIAVVRKTIESPLFYEFTALFKYQRRMWLGTTYRKSGAFGISVGGTVWDQFAMNYSYEFGGPDFAGGSSGTHDISIGFLIGQKSDNTASVFHTVTPSKPYIDWLSE